MRLRTYFFLVVSLLLIHESSFSGPWLTAGEPWSTSADLATKSDIDLLAIYDLIEAPVLSWPIAWVNIGPQLLADETKEKLKQTPSYVQNAYLRILKRYFVATQTTLKTAAFLSGGSNINPFRTYQYQPRSNVNAGITGEKQGKHWAIKLATNYAKNNDLTKEMHLDDSYAYGFLGNWGIGVDKMPRWWSPAYSDSLILSANAPPLPTVTIQRMKSEAFQSKWLKWIGPWSLTSSLSVGGNDVPIRYPLIWLTNITFRPTEEIQFSASRVSFFAGSSRPLNRKMLYNLLTFQDNGGLGGVIPETEPGKQHAEFSMELLPRKDVMIPTSIYLHSIFNDSYAFDMHHHVLIPFKSAYLVGLSPTLPFLSDGLRVYFEYERLIQKDFFFYNFKGHPQPYNVYDNARYPYMYYGKILGSQIGSEATGFNLGGIMTEPDNSTDSFMIRYLQLNPFQFKGTGYPYRKQNILWFSLSRTFTPARDFGTLSGQVGYLKNLSQPCGDLESSFSGFLVWTRNF